MAGSEESPELTSSLTLRLPTKPVERWEAAGPPPEVVPRIPADTVGFLFIFLAASAFLSSLKRAGNISVGERALRKASSFCLSIMLGRCKCSLVLKQWERVLCLPDVYSFKYHRRINSQPNAVESETAIR
jgi:hypothetical protein